MKISIFIPAYNAATHISGVIDRIPQSLWTEDLTVWIINDGSSDKTGSICDHLAKNNERIKVIHFPQNKGYGTAVKKGLSLCRDDQCDFAVCLHSDGQYPPEFIPEFVKLMKTGSIDILQGSRIASGTALIGGMPLYKYISGKVLTLLENLVFGLRMSDYHSGFLLYSNRALQEIPFDSLSSSFDFDLEVIASARSRKLNISERPIPTRYADEISYLNPITYGLRVLKVLYKYLTGGFL